MKHTFRHAILSALKRSLTVLGLVLLFSIATACSVEISQTQLIPTRTTAPDTATLAPSLTLTATPTVSPTLTPTATQPGDPTLTPTLVPSPTAAFSYSMVTADKFTLQVIPGYPPSLEGHLLFLCTMEDGLQGLAALDLKQGTVAPLFVTPSKAWLLSLSVASDSSQILVSYAPPPQEGQPSYGYTDLYVLKPDGSIQPVLERTVDIEAYFGSFFNPAGDYIYYSHFFADSTAPSGFRYHINRVGYPAGTPEVVVENAFWERLSPDGSKLAFVTFDNRAFDELFVSDPDGKNPVRALDPAQFPTVDAPFFSPDNQYLYFSAVSEPITPLTWWEKLMGVRIALAHNVPSDFWRVSLLDGTVEQITNLKDMGMFGTFSPDGNQIAFISGTGLYVMRPDGSGLMKLVDSSSLYGNVEWVR